MLTVEEVARTMRVNPETVRRWLRARKLHGVRTSRGPGGGTYRIPSDELDRFIREQS